MPNLLENLRYNKRTASAVSHVLVISMTMCLAINCISLGEWTFFNWNARGLLLVCLLVSIEATYTYRLVKRLPGGDSRKTTFHIVEWIVLLLVIKIFTELRFGLESSVQNLINWPENFLLYFLTGSYVLNTLIVFIVWLASIFFASNLKEMEDIGDILKGYSSTPERKMVHGKLVRRYLGIGLVMVVMTGVMRQNLYVLKDHSPGPDRTVIVLLAYFLIGLVLLSLSRFANLQGKWEYEEAGVQQNLASRWILYSAVFLAVLAILALFLPTNYSFRLFEAIMVVIGWLSALVQFIVALVLLPFAYLSSLFGKPSTQEPDVPRQPPALEDYLPQTPEGGMQIWEALKSVLFWVVFLAVIIYAFRQYIQTNQEFARALRRFALWRWLTTFWEWLTRQARGISKGVSKIVETGIRRLRMMRITSKPRGKWQYISLRKLNPRQRILFYYFALIRRADEVGAPRRAWQTPKEYSHELQADLPDSQESVTALTESFMDARYSPHDITPENASQTRSQWEHIRHLLRTWRQRRDKKANS